MTTHQALVTGGAGFIGANLTHALAAEGYSVRVLDDLSTGRPENLDGADVELVKASVVDREALGAAIRGADVVFHHAAIPSVARSVEDPVATHDTAATGTLHVLLAAREAGVRRVVYASSCSVYGDDAELPCREDRAPHPHSPYAAAKLAGELYCQAFAGTYGIEAVALRYFNVFGPRQDPTSDYAAVVPLFITKVLGGEPPRINGDGRQTRDFVYVENVVAANLAAATAPAERVAGETFNIASGRATTINELLGRIQQAAGPGPAAEYGPPRLGDVRHSWADVTRARAGLGYEPEIGLDEGLAATVAWFAAR